MAETGEPIAELAGAIFAGRSEISHLLQSAPRPMRTLLFFHDNTSLAANYC